MTETEARSAVESACQRADVVLTEFAFYDIKYTNGGHRGATVLFDGHSRSIPPGQTMLCALTCEHGRKLGLLSGLARASAEKLEAFTYNFAVDWLNEVQKPKGASND